MASPFKTASTLDWAAQDSENEDDDVDVDLETEDIEGNDESDESSDEEESQTLNIVTTADEKVKPKTTTAPMSKKEKKIQRENELRELELALSEFGVKTNTIEELVMDTSKVSDVTESPSKSDSKKRKKKKNATNSAQANTASDIVVEISTDTGPEQILIDRNEVLKERTKKLNGRKTNISVAEKLASAELKSKSSESDKKKKKPKDKSKLGYSETSY